MSKPKRQIRRREFLKVAAAAASLPAARYAKILGANDRVRVGIVGFSDRFRQAHLPAYGQLGKELNFEIVAVSDIWSRRREEGVAEIARVMGTQPRPFRNNEEMYAARATDAVVISTADFQHAYHGVEAMQAGQDAYIEKPLAHRIEDAIAIRDAVKKSDRVVQIGTQRRSATNYQMANEYIRSGKFGDIVMAEMTWNVNQPGRWRRPQLVAALKEQDTDWKRFLCNLPSEPWDPRKYLEYRLFWPYSSGIPDQWMVHQIDTVHWFTGLSRPRSVVANGGVYLWKDGRKSWDTATIVFEYGPLDDPSKGFQVVYSSRMTNSAGKVPGRPATLASPPSSAGSSPTAASMVSGRDRSQSTVGQLREGWRSRPTTARPAARSRAAVAAPMPEAAPVTTTGASTAISRRG